MDFRADGTFTRKLDSVAITGASNNRTARGTYSLDGQVIELYPDDGDVERASAPDRDSSSQRTAGV